ncbi:MAG: hypothetical protein ACOC1S_01915, partial [bacterium]
MKKLSVLFILSALVLTATFTANASGLTARSMGMGGAYTAVGEDISTVLYNPAGITRSGNFEIHGSGGFMVSDRDKLDDALDLPNYLEGDFEKDDIEKVYQTIPDNLNMKGQAFIGGNIKNLGAAVNITDDVSTTTDDNYRKLENIALAETIVSYGKEIVSPAMDIGSIAYGANFKYSERRKDSFELEYYENIDDPEENKMTTISTSDNGFGADLGVLIKTTDIFRIGMQLENVVNPEYKMTGEKETTKYNKDSDEWDGKTKSYTGETVKSDRKLNVGAALDVPVLGATLAVDLEDFPLFSDGDMITRMGLEKNLIFNGLTL